MGNELFVGCNEAGPLGEAGAEQVKGVGAAVEKRQPRVQVVDRAQTMLRLVRTIAYERSGSW